MTDLVLILALLGFIALCVAYVGWCNRIAGVDEIDAAATVESRGQQAADRLAARPLVSADAEGGVA